MAGPDRRWIRVARRAGVVAALRQARDSVGTRSSGDEATRMAHFVLARLGASDEKRPPHVAMLLENHLELVSLFGGCGIAGATLFGINTGLRGEILAGVINHARARLLVVAHREEILTQSLATFRQGLRDQAFGELWVGGARPSHRRKTSQAFI